MRIRKDLATTKSGIRKSIAEILIHEGEHHRGTHLEGVAELVKTVKLENQQTHTMLKSTKPQKSSLQKLAHKNSLMHLVATAPS